MAQQNNQVVDSEYIPHKARKLGAEPLLPFGAIQSEFSPQLSNIHSRYFNPYPASTGLLNGFCPKTTDTGKDRDNGFQSIPTISLHNHRIPLQPSDHTTQQSLRQFSEQVGTSNYSQIGMWPDQVVPPDRSEVIQHPRTGNRGRTTYSDEQVAELEDIFAHNPYPTPQARQQLSRDIKVPESKIKIWFQNRRARAKKQRTGTNAWRVRSAPVTSVQTEQNSNNNNVTSKHNGSNSKVHSFVDKFLALPVNTTVPEAQTKWSKGGITTQSSDLGAQSSLSLSGLTIRPVVNGLASTQQPIISASVFNPNQQILSNPTDFYYGNGNQTSCYNEKESYNPAMHSQIRCQNFPSRFPVISSTSELSFFQCYNKSNAPKPATSYGQRSFNANTPCQFSHEISAKSDPNQSLKGVLHQNASYGSSGDVYCSDTAEVRQMSTSTTFFSSPPPIRRFVFPFKNLLENSSMSGMAEASTSSDKFNVARDYWCYRNNQPAQPYELTTPQNWADQCAGQYATMCENIKYSEPSNYPSKFVASGSMKSHDSNTTDFSTGLSQVQTKGHFSHHRPKVSSEKASPTKILTSLEDINRTEMTNDYVYPYNNEALCTKVGHKGAMKVTICTDNMRWSNNNEFQKTAGSNKTKAHQTHSTYSSEESEENLCAIERKKKSPGTYTNWLKV